ncbi:hypothetical protein GCM10010391_45400 [Streptomyces anthocyanicus]|nr:hypothetical protein GCM10010391_45400 [Streptomyces anthocyanicus]
MRGKVVTDDRDADLGRVESAQVAAELQKLGALLDRLDVAVELVRGQVQGCEEVAHTAVAVVRGPPPAARFPGGVLELAPAAAHWRPGFGIRLSGPNSCMQKTTSGSPSSGTTLPSAIA